MNAPGTILITGANRGIGLGLTGHFLTRGWRVLAACRRPAEATELAKLARAHEARCEVLTLEVRDAASVAALGASLLGRKEPLDVLVNNAGINPAPRDTGVDGVSVELVSEALDTNLLGALRVLQAALPALRRSASPRIVNISSGAGSLAHNSATRPQPAYCISKAALNMLTRRAARDLPGITVVSVSPGWIKTDMGGADAELGLHEATGALAQTIETLQPAQSGQWLDRFGQPSPYAW
jgi:NAD(P)-dependent dehydrogenase (short-subunit alcohol dehydrogenase family)